MVWTLRHLYRGESSRLSGWLCPSGEVARQAQLQRLKAGRHPAHLCKLPDATNIDGLPLITCRGYARKKGSDGNAVDENFRPYAPEQFAAAKPSTGLGRSAEYKARFRHTKIQLRRKRDMLRCEFNALVDSFVGEGSDEVRDEEEEAHATFWNQLEPIRSSTLANIPTSPPAFGCKGRPSKPSRAQRLGV